MDLVNEELTSHSRHSISQSEADVRAIERQIRWECRAVEQGVARYASQTAGQSLADIAPGIRAMQEAVKGMVPALRILQEEAADGIANAGRGRQPDWWWLLTTMSPEKLAVITVRSVLSNTEVRDLTADTALAHSFTTVCFRIAQGMRLELEYEDWCAREKGLKKVDPEHTDLAKALLYRTKKVDAAAVKRWWAKIGKARSEQWSEPERLQAGSILLECLATHGGGWFEITVDRIKGGKTARFVKLTEEASAAMRDINARAELHRPYHMPMLTKPREWRRVNEAEA